MLAVEEVSYVLELQRAQLVERRHARDQAMRSKALGGANDLSGGDTLLENEPTNSILWPPIELPMTVR